MAGANGNGKHRVRTPAVACERSGCRIQNTKLVRLGLCDAHFNELLEVGPDDFPWKKHASRRARNELGHWITKLDEEFIQKAVSMIRATGLEIEGASFGGIHRSQWHRWMTNGRSADPHPLCAQLVREVEDALAAWELGLVGSIMAGDPRVKLDLLKHHPRTKSRYAPITRTEIANPPGESFRTKHALDLSNLSLEQKRQMAALLEAAGAEGDAEDIVDAEIIELPQRAGGEP